MKTVSIIISLFCTGIATAQNVSLQWERIDTTTGNHSSHFNAMVTDINNNIYLTGYKSFSSTSDECIILKYTHDGVFQWVDNFGYPYVSWKNNMNEGKRIKISPNGNIILAANTRRFGDKFEIRSYNATGSLNWDLISDDIQYANGSEGHIADITVLPNNNIGVFANLNYANGQGMTYSVFKINSSGSSIWSGSYSANSAHDYGAAIEHDTAGILYITGGVFNFDNGSYDFTTLNLHPNGSNDWIARFNYISGLKDIAYDMVVDNNQNQFITGISEITTNQNDMSTIMQNSYGTRLWQDQYGGSAGMNDTAVAIVTDNNLNSYVIGTTLEDTLGTIKKTITLIKYDGTGNRLWVKKFLGNDNLGGMAKAISIHKYGNVYITGEVESASEGNNILVVSLDPSGNILWTYSYNGSTSQNDYVNDIRVTDDYKIYVSGSATINNKKKHLVFKLDHLTALNELTAYNHPVSIQNPLYLNNTIYLNYNSNSVLSANFYVTDISGRLIYMSEEKLFSGAGKLEKPLDISPGMYMITLTNNHFTVSEKLLVIN